MSAIVRGMSRMAASINGSGGAGESGRVSIGGILTRLGVRWDGGMAFSLFEWGTGQADGRVRNRQSLPGPRPEDQSGLPDCIIIPERLPIEPGRAAAMLLDIVHP